MRWLLPLAIVAGLALWANLTIRAADEHLQETLAHAKAAEAAAKADLEDNPQWYALQDAQHWFNPRWNLDRDADMPLWQMRNDGRLYSERDLMGRRL